MAFWSVAWWLGGFVRDLGRGILEGYQGNLGGSVTIVGSWGGKGKFG